MIKVNKVNFINNQTVFISKKPKKNENQKAKLKLNRLRNEKVMKMIENGLMWMVTWRVCG